MKADSLFIGPYRVKLICQNCNLLDGTMLINIEIWPQTFHIRALPFANSLMNHNYSLKLIFTLFLETKSYELLRNIVQRFLTLHIFFTKVFGLFKACSNWWLLFFIT